MPRASKTTPDSVSDNISFSQPNQKKKYSWLILTIVFLLILLVASAGAAVYFYYQFKKGVPIENAENREIENIVLQISQSMELPEGEVPTLATVTDKDKLAEQPFFQKAENGDKVLIYTNSGRAILYRPSTKKIVDVTTVNVNTPAPDTSQPSESVTAALPAPGAPSDTVEKVVVQNVSTALYNGSTKTGMTNTLESQLKASFENVEIVTKEKAAKSDYTGNLVIDLSGQNATLAEEIASSIGGTVGSALPEGEIHPNTDLLIIAGSK